MMTQYLEIKSRYRDALLFYRMGDFYEMFFDDAVAASAALDIALTKRGRHLGQDIPMCGVPVHSSDGYLLSLIKNGFRVAICEQLEDPSVAKKRGAKSVVKRDVVRLVTPGTLTEESLLKSRKNNYLAAYSEIRGEGAFAWVDASTGEFRVEVCPRVMLAANLARLMPREVLVSPALQDDIADVVQDTRAALTPLARSAFDSSGAQNRLNAFYGVSTLEGFGQFSTAEISALGAVLSYLDLTQKGNLPLLRAPVRDAPETAMQIDAATRRNLELNASLSGEKQGSLLSVIDRTVTGGGARLVAQRMNNPSTRADVIEARLDCVSFYAERRTLAEQLREALRASPDMERALSRLALDRGGPRDLGAVRSGINSGLSIFALQNDLDLPETLARKNAALTGFTELKSLLDRALVQELPTHVQDGGFVSQGFDLLLDETRNLRDESRSVIAKLQLKYADLTGINSIKIKFNNVLGYFVETPSKHADKMLGQEMQACFIHRQTTANAIRFTTNELAELASRILSASVKTQELESAVFRSLRDQLLARSTDITAASTALCEIDLATAFAELAINENWCRPSMESGHAFEIVDGRHPVVEQALKQQVGQPFVANNCDLTPEKEGSSRIWLLTGPNMAGKSTFLRQNALIAILAQMGCFVPARAARIGVVTQLFSRVGASDDLARGRSTFMVEMVETAAILNQAGPGALVILDEIGRGTATYDGLSIAWATLEHLHDVNKCRAVFATHYHELTSLSSKLGGIENATVCAREWEGEVVFLHEVVKGTADRSYGVQVARLAGLPASVVCRARSVLEVLENSERSKNSADLFDDLPLFLAATETPQNNEGSLLKDVRNVLANVRPDELRPIDALEIVYQLRGLLPQKD